MMHPMLTIAISAARTASRAILRQLDQMDKIEITEKEKNDFVTSSDKLSEQIIIQEIQKAYPRHAILSEEMGTINEHDYCWIIDPIDGTRNFMQGFMHFAISIAVMKKGELEVGMIYDPIRQELFTATKGQGAYLNSRRIRVSTTTKFEKTLIGTGFPFCNKENTAEYLKTFEKIFLECSDIRRSGSAALDLAYVACGRLDAFWESGLSIWDVAAGALMIKEAGGMITDFKGGDTFLKTGKIAASNFKLHSNLIEKLA